jgi:CPA2 family monovalent cation:H+ antiporter-2
MRMHIESTLIEIAIVVTAALGCGIILERFRQPALLGYIIAGVILGPSFLGLVHSRETVNLLAELGVLMLLFVVGLELSLRMFLRVWHVAVGCVILQTAGGLALTITLGNLFDWPVALIVLLACTFALSSTAVSVKMLESIDEMRTNLGRVAIGVLIAQDLAIVPMILIIRGLGDQSADIEYTLIAVKVFLSVGLLVGLVLYLSRKERLKLPFMRLVLNNHDFTPLMGLGFCFGFAAIAGLVGLSSAYGAFLAGLILGNSNERHVMFEKMTPIYSVLMMVFFLSIGLLIDLSYIWSHIALIGIILLFITVGKTALNISILHMLKQPWTISFASGVILAQLGEFSFLLLAVGDDVGIVDEESSKLIISLTAMSLAFSPLWMTIARRIHDRALRPTASLARTMDVAFGEEIKKCRKLVKKLTKSQPETDDDKA